MLRLNKKVVFSLVLLLFLVAFLYNVNRITGYFFATTNWEKQWENRMVVDLDNTEKYYETEIVFDMYKPSNCRDGLLVTDGFRELNFLTFDEKYSDGVCVSAFIQVQNPIYSERRISITPAVEEQPERRISITGRAIMNTMTMYVFYGRKPVLPEYSKLQNDPDFDVTVLEQTLENGTLIVIFTHDSDMSRSIDVNGDVSYTLSHSESEANEEVTLEVYNWVDQYFQLIVE